MMDNRALLAASAILLALAACSSGPEDNAADPAPVADADPAGEAVTPEPAEAAGGEELAMAEGSAAAEDSEEEPAPSATPTATTAAAPAALTQVAAATPPQVYMQRCAVCHTWEKGGAARLGPNLYGVYGEKMGEGSFAFSQAVKNAALPMDDATLHAWLENPRKLIPGNRMSFPGLRDEAQRQEIIDFLKALK